MQHLAIRPTSHQIENRRQSGSIVQFFYPLIARHSKHIVPSLYIHRPWKAHFLVVRQAECIAINATFCRMDEYVAAAGC